MLGDTGCFKINQEYTTRIFQCLATLDWTPQTVAGDVLLKGLETVFDLTGDKVSAVLIDFVQRLGLL